MRVLILGGDGYLGWPTAMHFSSRDHEVHVVDNYLRRNMHSGNGSDSLTPIRSLTDRLDIWRAGRPAELLWQNAPRYVE